MDEDDSWERICYQWGRWHLLILRLSFGSRFPLGTSTDTDSAYRIRRAGAAATRNSYQEKGHTWYSPSCSIEQPNPSELQGTKWFCCTFTCPFIFLLPKQALASQGSLLMGLIHHSIHHEAVQHDLLCHARLSTCHTHRQPTHIHLRSILGPRASLFFLISPFSNSFPPYPKERASFRLHIVPKINWQ